MADALVILSRRTLLGAACAAPLGAAIPPVRSERSRGPLPSEAEANQTQWTRALACYRRAEARIRAIEGHADDATFDRALDRFNAALRRLLAVSAPDLVALAAKIEIAICEDVAELSFGPLSFSQLAQDARRLAAAAS